jgi:hypothetical protein
MIILKTIIKYLKLITFNVNELKFIIFTYLNANNYNSIKKNENVLFAGMETDYYSLCLSSLFKLDKNLPKGKITLYLPLLCFTKTDPQKKKFLHFSIFIVKNFFIYLRNFKTQLLYKKLTSDSLSLNNFNIINEYKYINLSRRIVSKIKNKKDVKRITLNGINIGREIYDTFIRFSGKTTLDLNDYFLVEIMAKILYMQKKLPQLIKEKKIKFYYSRQTAYIHHGYVANLLIKKKVKVFLTGSRNEYAYRYNGRHYHYPYNFRIYKKIFKSLKNKKEKLTEAKNILDYRFKGIKPKQDFWIDNFQNHNPYKDDKKNNYKFNSKCVIFLHCFVDSPLMGGDIIFDDYSDWITKTLNFLEKKDLSKYTIIKPHPDAKPDSIKFENYLMNKFPKFKWLDRNNSNKEIFKNKLNIGITVRGNVIPELAFHGILPIAAGENISQSFSFVLTAKNKKEYFNLISKNIHINHKNKMYSKKNEIYQLTYMSLIYNLENIDTLAKKIALKNINFNNSESLNKFRYLYLKTLKNFTL